MTPAEKQEAVRDLHETFKGHQSLMLVDFTGLDVADSIELRRKVVQADSGYKVVKNRLALRAVDETDLTPLREHFQGPTAIAYTGNDAVALAKVLKDFIKDHPEMSFKAGVVDGQALSAEELSRLAELPPREELMAKFVFLLKAPLTSLATALRSPVQKLGAVLKQLEEKKQEQT